MEFNVKEWRKYYDKIQTAGKILKDSRPDWEGNAPLVTLSDAAIYSLKMDIKVALRGVRYYLDKCNMKLSKPLWYYDSKDPKTWYSHRSFKYMDRIKYEEGKR